MVVVWVVLQLLYSCCIVVVYMSRDECQTSEDWQVIACLSCSFRSVVDVKYGHAKASGRTQVFSRFLFIVAKRLCGPHPNYKNTLHPLGLHQGSTRGLYTQLYIIFLHFYDPTKMLKNVNLIKIGSLWVWKNLWGYGRKVHAKFWPWGMPWDPIYDYF